MAASGFSPLDELSWAIGLLRDRAEEWRIIPDQIAVCGFSAGGHLAGAAGLLAANRPDAMILGYPAFSFGTETAVDASENPVLRCLIDTKQSLQEQLEHLCLPRHVTPDAPPLFLFQTAEDRAVGMNSLELINAYARRGLLFEYHVFQFGPHGLSLATPEAADGSSRVIEPRVAAWFDLSVSWLKRIFGEPVFTDKESGRLAGMMKELSRKQREGSRV